MANKKVITTVAIVGLALVGVIFFRINSNLKANQLRAERASQGQAVEVEGAPVARRDINPVITLSANLEAFWVADISPKVDGRIDKMYVDEGDVVKAGAVLAILDTNELAAQVTQAEGNLLVAKAGLEQAEMDLKRAEMLAKQDAIAAQALDSARIKRDLAVGQVKSAEGNLSYLKTRLDNAYIVAPRSGTIVKRYLQAGFYAKAGSPIVSLADDSALLAKATLGEGQITQVKVGAPATVIVNALDGQSFSGTVTRISPAAALPARTFTAEINIPNENGILKAGMFAKVELAGNRRNGVLAVPEGALVLREDQKTVYLVDSENKVRLQLLKLGYVGNGWAEVLDGVQEGDLIVTAGQNKLREGSSVKISAPKEGAQ